LLAHALLFFTAIQGPPADAGAHRARLLDGIEALPRLGAPGTVFVFGPTAFPVLTANEDPEAVVAAATLGKGRMVAWAHNMYFLDGALGHAGPARDLFRNALAWSAPEVAAPKVGVLGWGEDLTAVFDEAGIEGSDKVPPEQLGEFDALIWREGADYPDDQLDRIVEFVENGGGLLIGVCPWGWEQVNRKEGWTLRDDLPQNKVMRLAGLAFAYGGAWTRSPKGFLAADSRPEFAHAGLALAAATAGKESAKRMLHLFRRAVTTLPADEPLLMQPLATLLGGVEKLRGLSPKRPIEADDTFSRLRARVWYSRWTDDPSAEVPVAPGSQFFPGAVSKRTVRIRREQPLRAQEGVWASTGVYLPAGERLHASLLEGAADGWTVHVGSHVHDLWHDEEWPYWPAVRTSFSLETALAGATSAFGGLVYLEAGAGAGDVRVALEGVVEAPYYDLENPVDSKEWKRRRKADAPWAELAGRLVVVTVPASALKKLDDPGDLMDWWDRVVENQCEILGQEFPERLERFVADPRHSGFDSGYPIRVPGRTWEKIDDQGRVEKLVDLGRLRKEGDWDCFVALAERRLADRWWITDRLRWPLVELAALGTFEKLVGMDPWKLDWTREREAEAARHLKGPRSADDLYRNPWAMTVMFLHVRKEFGWEVFGTALKRMSALPEEKQPLSDEGVFDLWALELSRAAERDLGAYFAYWGMPISQAARRAAAEWQAWNVDLKDLR